MKKWTLFLLMLLLAVWALPADAQKKITAKGMAANQRNIDIACSRALDEAQRNAVEQATGVMITSTTNVEGLWAIYLPDELSGEYYVGPNAYACEDSNAVIPAEGGCILAGKLPDGQLISLPLNLDVAIEFQLLPLTP
jgi:hypothetical protein